MPPQPPKTQEAQDQSSAKIVDFKVTPSKDTPPVTLFLPDAEREALLQHFLGEFQSLVGQHERATTEILRLQQRVAELQTGQAQIQGALRELEAISNKCDIDLRKFVGNKA